MTDTRFVFMTKHFQINQHSTFLNFLQAKKNIQTAENVYGKKLMRLMTEAVASQRQAKSLAIYMLFIDYIIHTKYFISKRF